MADSRTIMITIDANGKAALAEMSNVSAGVGKMSASATSGLKSFRLGSDSVTSGLLGMGAGALSLGLLTASIKASVDAMNQMERAAVGLAVTARYAGEDINKTNAAAKSLASDGLMSATEASQALQNLLSRGYTLEQAITLMNRLKDSASFNRQAHLEYGQAIVGATEGLKNENSVLVDNAGVTKNVSVMWKEYALQLGKGVDSLTQAEKRQAEYNGILAETEGQTGNAARMAETFQGAQARLNQQIFESKATLGQALVPALSNVLIVLSPVVEGFRDMIGGIAMSGTAVANFVDKIGIVYDVAQKGLFNFDTKELKRRFAEADRIMDEEKQRIYTKFSGGALPDIGADTGKRRKDTVLPDSSAAKQKAAAEKNAREISTILEEARNRDLLIGKESDEKELIQMDQKHAQEIRKLLDLKASKAQVNEEKALQEKERNALLLKQKEDQEWASAQTTVRMAVESANAWVTAQEQKEAALVATRTHQQELINIEMTAAEARLQFIGQDEAALTAHYAWKQEQLATQHIWEMENLTLNQEERLAKEREFEEQSYLLQTEAAQKKAELWWNGAQTYINFAQQMTTMGLQMALADEKDRANIGKRILATAVRFMAQQLQNYMFMKAKENVMEALSASGRIATEQTAAQTSLGILEAQAIATAAYLAAMSMIPYVGSSYYASASAMSGVAGGAIPAAMTAVGATSAAGTAASLATAAAWAAGGVLVGALGEAAASAIEGSGTTSLSSTSGGTTTAGSTTTASTTTSGTKVSTITPIIHVNIYGNVVDNDKFAREMTLALQKAYKDAA